MIYRNTKGSRSKSSPRLPNYMTSFSKSGRRDGIQAWSGANPMRFSGSHGTMRSSSFSWTRSDSGVANWKRVEQLREIGEFFA